MIVHQVDNPSIAQSFHSLGSVPTLHVSYHMGEHYNSVRLASDPNLYNIPAINYPIGHELKEIDSFEETKEMKPVLIAAKPDD